MQVLHLLTRIFIICSALRFYTTSAHKEDRLRSSSSRYGSNPLFQRSKNTCKDEGYFPDSDNCKKFFRCVKVANGNGTPKYTKYEFECAPGTSFDRTTSNCNYDALITCSTDVPSTQPASPSLVTSKPVIESEEAIASSDDCVYELNLGYSLGSPDGFSDKKQMLLFNGQFPGPEIRCKRGKFLVVRVTNSMDEPTSIHWHGIEQNLSPFYDGPESVTQCPIVRGTSMVYRFQLFQAGTYWYHSHHSNQYTDGAWGPLIIENTPDEVRRSLYDEDIIITINDWHHDSGKNLGDKFLRTGAIPIPDSILVNGIGSSTCKTTVQNDRDCFPNVTTQAPAVINVVPGKRYRIRVINTSASSRLTFSIDGHKLQTIEADGVDTVVVPLVDTADIWTAQRYSFLVAMNGSLSEYWIRATGNIGSARGLAVLKYDRSGKIKRNEYSRIMSRLRAEQGRPAVQAFDWDRMANERACSRRKRPTERTPSNFSRIFRVDADTGTNFEIFPRAVVTLPTTRATPNPVMLDPMKCRPYHQGGSTTAPDFYDSLVVINAANCLNVTDNGAHLCFNDIQFIPGDTRSLPVLFQMIRGDQISNTLSAKFYTPNLNEVVQVVINNRHGGSHPWHLHGHTFWVMGTGQARSGDYNATRDQGSLSTEGVRRDTTHSFGGSWVVLRYWTGNPGTWLLHCHINWHLAAGFGGVLIEAQQIAQQIYCSPPQEVLQVCKLAGVDIDIQ